jgi:hypothetical protein
VLVLPIRLLVLVPVLPVMVCLLPQPQAKSLPMLPTALVSPRRRLAVLQQQLSSQLLPLPLAAMTLPAVTATATAIKK